MVRHPHPPPLPSRVAFVWRLRAEAGALPPLLAMPDGGTDIVWNRGDDAVDVASGIAVPAGSCAIVGTHATASGVRPAGEVDLLGVRLRPGGLFGIVGTDLGELGGTVVPADAAGLRLAIPADQPLHESLSDDALAAAVDGASPWRDDQLLRVLLSRADVLAGRTGVAALAGVAGVSVRQLERRALRASGHTLKRLLRLRRLDNATQLRRSAGFPGWAPVAAAAGFADQAHLSREALALTGLRPRELDVASVQASCHGLDDGAWYPRPEVGHAGARRRHHPGDRHA